MPDQATDQHLTISVDRTHAERALQINLSQTDTEGNGIGYRLAGPKHYNMGTTELLSAVLTERDATEIRHMLDSVFPPKPLLSDAERTFLAFALDLAFDKMASDDGFTADDEAALAALRKLAEGGAR